MAIGAVMAIGASRTTALPVLVELTVDQQSGQAPDQAGIPDFAESSVCTSLSPATLSVPSLTIVVT